MQEMITQKRTRGRPSSFSREAVVKQVMEMFWQRGYHDLSFNEIARETGLTRASLYHAFETKEALYLEALQTYFNQAPDLVLRQTQAGDSIGQAFLTVLTSAANTYSSDPARRGCMAVNCINELIGGDEMLNRQVQKIYADYKQRIKELFEQAIEQKELPEYVDAEVSANIMFAFMNGLSVFSKSNPGEAQMKQMASQFLRNIGFKLNDA